MDAGVGGADDGWPASAVPARYFGARLVARRQSHCVPPADDRRSHCSSPRLGEKSGQQIYSARSGVHNHFPLWSPDAAFIYFVQGFPPDEMDIWRIRPTGGEPERLTFHDARVTFPTFLDNRTLLYLATADDGSGPWIHALDVERRVTRRISTGVEEYESLAASADGRRLVATGRARRWAVASPRSPTTLSTNRAPRS